MVLLAIAILLVIFLATVLWWFFKFAFVRGGEEQVADLDSDLNKPLIPYRKFVEKGMAFVKEQPYEELYAESFDGLRLYGRYYRHENADCTMILFHGYRSLGIRDFSCAVQMYYEAGLNVLLVDQRAHGKSEGKLITFGVKERRDVLSWINRLLEYDGNIKRILLGGMSMGATTVMLSTELGLPQNVCGIIADCGFTSPIDIIRKVAVQHFKIKGTVVLPILNLICKLFGKFSLYGVSTETALKNNEIPIMIIHGKADNFVPVEMSERAYSANKGEKLLVIVDNADHGFSFLVDPYYVGENLKNFIDSVL